MASLAVLIDCWKLSYSPARHRPDTTQKYNQCMQNIQDFCLQESDLISVCLATYGDPHITKKPREGAWWQLADQFFNLETKFDAMRQSWQQTEFEDIDLTHPVIRHMPHRHDQQRFAAFDTIQLLYYCNYIMPEIDKIYFLGAAWDFCVKIRPLGWLQVAALKYHHMFRSDKQFLSHKQCVLTQKCEFPWQFEPCWRPNPESNILELAYDQIVW